MDATRWLGIPLISGLILSGCYLSHEPRASDAPVEHSARFAGDWQVMAAFGWALIETTTVYRFHDDGRIEVIDQVGGTYFEGPAGQWTFGPPSRESDAVRCTFGAAWWSEGAELHIESDCSDDAERTLVLRPAVVGNAGPELEIVAPEDATGFWEFEGREGVLRRCSGPC